MDTLLTRIGNVDPGLHAAVAELISSGKLGSAVHLEQTESTNSDALEELQGCDPNVLALPRLTLADHQSAGRGRQGNRWQSDDASLTFSLSVGLDLSSPSSGMLSLAVGVAAARAMEFLLGNRQIALKWPNDLCWWDESPEAGSKPGAPAGARLRKLGGILIESAAAVPNHCVIGMGINLLRTPTLSSPTATPAACLADLPGRRASRQELLSALIESLVEVLEELSQSPREIIAAYRQRCALTGRDLTLQRNETRLEGHCTGISEDGSLELIVNGSRQTFRSGEICQLRSSSTS